MGENYKFKEILFGLYKEYILIQEKLDSLKRCILLDGNNLEDIKFHLIRGSHYDEIRMICTLYDKKSELEKMFDRIKIRFGIFPNDRNLHVIRESENYEIDECPEILDKLRKDEFNGIIDDIFKMDFVRNMEIFHCSGKSRAFVFDNSVSMYSKKMGMLEFRTFNDLYLHAYSLKGRLDEDKIMCMLNTEFDKDLFPKYYKDVIENSENYMKRVRIIGDFGHSKKCKLEIFEDSKKLVLVKR